MKIRVVRESGGLGDLIRLFPVFKGLRKKYPDAEITFFCLNHYRDLMRHCPEIDVYIPCTMHERRPRLAPLDHDLYPYLDRGVKYDLEFDMYCPAYHHEVLTDGEVTEERGHLWCDAADVEFTHPVFPVWEKDRIWARNWIEERMIDPENLVVFQPFGTTRARNWAEMNWHNLVGMMEEGGIMPVAIDVCNRIRKFPCARLVHPTFGQLAAVLELAQVCISGDSGMFHFAAAVGTKALGLFGETLGRVMIQGYPPLRTFFIQGDPTSCKHPPCQYPCYGRWSRKYGEQCRDHGCPILDAIPVEEVYRRVCEIYRTIPGSSWMPNFLEPSAHPVR